MKNDSQDAYMELLLDRQFTLKNLFKAGQFEIFESLRHQFYTKSVIESIDYYCMAKENAEKGINNVSQVWILSKAQSLFGEFESPMDRFIKSRIRKGHDTLKTVSAKLLSEFDLRDSNNNYDHDGFATLHKCFDILEILGNWFDRPNSIIWLPIDKDPLLKDFTEREWNVLTRGYDEKKFLNKNIF